MKSPFPGMDPYIEACRLWEDFHNHLIEQIGRGLADVVPDRYLVRTGERSFIVLEESDGSAHHAFLPDVRVTTSRRGKRDRSGGTAVAEPARIGEPITMRAFIADEHRERFVEIYDTDPEQRLITTIEVLSPSNKQPGTPGWDLYQRKRQSLLLSFISLIELDLLRGGQRMPMLDPWPDSPYTLLVANGKWAPECRVWPAYYRQPLPPIPVPLTKPDADVPLNLQPMIAEIYRRFRYERSIDYGKPLTPALPPEDTQWLAGRLRRRQHRA